MKHFGSVLVILTAMLVRPSQAYITYYDTLYSAAMDTHMRVAVMVPIEYLSQTDKHYPVLYTIPGSATNADNYDCWSEMMPMKQEIMTKPMLVAMYAGYYLPEFFFEEFIPWVESNYRTIPNGNNRAVGGFSAGGFNSIDYILDHPDWFSSALTMSAGAWANQLVELKDSLDADAPIPPIGNYCGTEDFLLNYATTLNDSLVAWGHETEFITAPGGHEWAYWRDTSPLLVDFAWAHFDLQTDVADYQEYDGAADTFSGQELRFDISGRRLGSGEVRQGIVIVTDGKSVRAQAVFPRRQ